MPSPLVKHTPPKKAAKKSAAKKHAKKAAKKHAGHAPGRDLRRAFEHISRVRILHLGMQAAALAQVDTLARLAQGALLSDDPRSAADLLRAAEHIAFGSLAPLNAIDAPSRELTEAAREEYEGLLERGKDHMNHREKPLSPELRGIHKAMLANAAEAYKAGALHRALEFARGAEALTHTHVSASAKKLPPAGGSQNLLLS